MVDPNGGDGKMGWACHGAALHGWLAAVRVYKSCGGLAACCDALRTER